MAVVNSNGVLAGQVAVVTGASRGIGEAIARRFAMEGAKVVVSARTVEESDHFLEGTIKQTVKTITDAGGEACAIRSNLADAADRQGLIEQAIDQYGQVDILVNNAAVTWFVPVTDFSEKRFRTMMDVQVWAPFEMTQLCLSGMLERGQGWILNISSHAAIHPVAKTPGGHGGTVYGMCKAALERFTTGLAQETFGRGVGVNVISPGLVATPGVVHHKLINEANKNRVTPVEHMAEACLRLCHGDANEITGRIDYADQVIDEFKLEPADLI
ncbi:MAG: SDR family NAD(P)-dependent oxidoreductase [Gammaproteobacteria bacterium]|nr:SDR family NAD(P)-dependent oxidoreductase [Gammaproteobacteria bacterium]